MKHAQSVKRPLKALAFAAALGPLLVACTTSTKTNDVPAARVEPGQDSKPSFSQFPDIPVPAEAELDVDRTLILGSGTRWLGRLVLTSGNNANALFNFYKRKMTEHNWQEITSVRAATSILTFTRGERVATVQIQGRTLRGSEALIMVSPRDQTKRPPNMPRSGMPNTGSANPPPVQQIR